MKKKKKKKNYHTSCAYAWDLFFQNLIYTNFLSRLTPKHFIFFKKKNCAFLPTKFEK